MSPPFYYGYVILFLCFPNMVFVRGATGSYLWAFVLASVCFVASLPAIRASMAWQQRQTRE